VLNPIPVSKMHVVSSALVFEIAEAVSAACEVLRLEARLIDRRHVESLLQPALWSSLQPRRS
jgi:hypothetical protein